MPSTERLLVTAALLLALAGCGDSETTAHRDARDAAKTEAEYYCTMTPAGNDADYIHSDQYKNCVKDQTTSFLGEWDAEHPGE